MRNKKIIYISTVETGSSLGVSNKIVMQCRAFEKIGFEVENLSSGIRSLRGQFDKANPLSYGINYRIIKKKIIQSSSNTIDYCYVRWAPTSRGLIDVLKELKEIHPNIKIILEIPTYPYKQELKGLINVPNAIRDYLYHNQLKKYVDIIVTPSPLRETKEIYGIKAMEIKNGIDIDVVKARTFVEHNESVINIIGVALLVPCHGYERIIEGIAKYYQCKELNEPEIKFYIIGEGSAKQDLQNLTKTLHLEDHIIFTGRKEGKELDEYYDLADIGVGSLGMYKINWFGTENALKTREYCAKGLPFITTSIDATFNRGDFEYCYVVDNSNTKINIHEINCFLLKLRKKYSDMQIINNMRCYADMNVSWTKILKDIITNIV